MHIPDGFLDAKTAAATGVLAVAGLGLALRQARMELPRRKVPLLGLSAAFVFAAQMLNFPVAGGTSGHMIGGVLAAVLLGPSAAVIAISAVLVVQCFLFADGGITALGANIFNMAIVGGGGGWLVYRLLSRMVKGLFGKVMAASFAAWLSTVMASVLCAGELAASGTVKWSVALPAMAGVHMLIGIGEGVITAMVLAAIAKVRPDLLGLSETAPAGPAANRPGPVIAFGLLISLGLAAFVAPFACTWPDGLDKTAAMLGFADNAAGHRDSPAPMGDYQIPGVRSEAVATSVAGMVGTVVVLALSWGLAKVLVPKTTPGQGLGEKVG